MVKYLNDLPSVPKAVGAYSQAAMAQGLLFLSGQIGLNPETGLIIEGGLEAETEQILKNIKAVLSSQSLTFDHVVKTTIFLTNMNDFKTVNGLYAAHMGQARPARSTIQVAALPLGALVEIEMIAIAAA